MNSQFTPLVGSLLSNSARAFGGKCALVCGESSWTYIELQDMASRIAGWLQKAGVGAGDVVGLYSPNCVEWLCSYYGALQTGAAVAPLNLMLTAEEAAYALGDCGAVSVFGTTDRLEAFEAMRKRTGVEHVIAFDADENSPFERFWSIADDSTTRSEPVQVDANAPCTVAYTSGTTGHPKGAVLSHRAVAMNTAMTATMHVRTAADVVVSALPCSHVYGNVVMNAAIAYGSTLVLHRSFDVESVLQSIQQHRATILDGVPTMYSYILNHPKLDEFDLSSLSRCTVGGQTMPLPAMMDVEQRLGCRLIELWGMTEIAGLGCTHSAYGPARLGSVGVPLPYVEVRVTATDNPLELLLPNEVGELQARGPVTMDEYLGNPESTRETLLLDGWIRTGDLARIDEDGYVYVVDRLKDMVITGGFNIYPAEIERVISGYPGIAMVAVAGIYDAVKGELAIAYIVPRHDVSIDIVALEMHCREHLAAYKVPRGFRIVDDIPKTSTGKVLRRRLREMGEN